MKFQIIIPVIIIFSVYLIACLISIWKKDRSLTYKILWTIVCMISMPLGGLAYYLWG